MSTIYEKEAMLNQLDGAFADIKSYILAAVGHDELHEVEQTLFRQLQLLGRSMLECFVAESGTGYEAGNPPLSEAGVPLEYKGTVDSPYFSIFGEIQIGRAGYAGPSGGYVYPVDAQLNLPARKYSYLLQKWLQASATDMDFRTTVERFNEIFDFSFFPEVPQRLGESIAAQVTPFYAQVAAPAPETEGSHLGLSADGKGVRIIRSERIDSKDEATFPQARRGKGEKRGTKKEAVVTVDFSFQPQARDPEEIVKALLKQFTEEERQRAQQERQKRRQEGLPQPREARNKHVRATFQGKEDAFRYLMERVLKRDPTGQKRLVALLDGDPHLETVLREQLKVYHLEDRLDALILDIIHVSEYVWDVGTALHGERSPQRAQWVEDRLRAILQGKVGRVIGGFKQILTKNQLRKAQQNALQKAITYFENHRHMMDYAVYLTKGYPIATGLVEGTCGSLVKDRMEQSGMRWSLAGAQTILQQRAVTKNGDWETFWPFYIESERDRLYPTGYERAA